MQALSSVPNCSAVVEQHGQRRWIIGCTGDCTAAGIEPGLDAVTARVLLPQINLIERSLRRERAALAALCGWAHQYSSYVSGDAGRRLLWLEIGSGLKLFGGLARITQLSTHGIAALGYTASGGIAPTPEAAALLAGAGVRTPVEQIAHILPAVEHLPVGALAITAEVGQALRASGVRSIGGVFQLGFDQLGRRFPQAVCDYLRRLAGTRPDAPKPYRWPRIYQRRIEFDAAVETLEGLSFCLRRMLGEFQGYLYGRDTGVQNFQLILEHEEHPATVLEVRTSRPQRDAGQLQALLREQLQRTEIAGAVSALRLVAKRFADIGDTQRDFFDDHRQQAQDWLALLDKLRARLGANGVRTLGLQSDHRPEKAWCVVRDSAAPAETMLPLPARPLWLLPEPRPIARLPLLDLRPERIEDGWWDHADAQRDYYSAQAVGGGRLWLFRNRRDAQWYVHGIWS